MAHLKSGTPHSSFAPATPRSESSRMPTLPRTPWQVAQATRMTPDLAPQPLVMPRDFGMEKNTTHDTTNFWTDLKHRFDNAFTGPSRVNGESVRSDARELAAKCEEVVCKAFPHSKLADGTPAVLEDRLGDRTGSTRGTQDLNIVRVLPTLDDVALSTESHACLKENFDGHIFTSGRNAEDAYRDALEIINLSGLESYSFQSSGQERVLAKECELAQGGAASCTKWLWGEDVERGEEHADSLLPHHVLVINHVDYYVTNWSLLAVGNPILIRTIDVTEPAGSTSSRMWFFKNNELCTTFNYGSAQIMGKKQKSFRHELWHYKNGAYVDLGRWIYRVHVRVLESTDYKFVLLLPIWCKPDGTGSIFNSLLPWNSTTLPWVPPNHGMIRRYEWSDFWNRITAPYHAVCPSTTEPMSRLAVNRSGKRHEWALMYRKEKGEQVVRVSLSNSPDVYSLGLGIFTEIMARKKINPTDLQEQFGVTKSRDRQFFLMMSEDLAGAVVDEVPFLHIYDVGNQNYLMPDKIKAPFALCRPFFQVPIVPMLNSTGNEKKGLTARITQFLEPHLTEIPPVIRVFMKDFVLEYAPDEALRAYTWEEALEQQDTAAKRARFHASMLDHDEDEDFVVRRGVFIKAENDGGEQSAFKGDPRFISPNEGNMKARYLCYMYSFKKGMTSKHPAVCVGKTVREVEDKVQSVARTNKKKKVAETDLSRMDGHKSVVGRVLFSLLLGVSFSGEDRQAALNLHRRCIGAKMRTPKGIKFTGGMTQGSGYADTTDNNTWDNLFMLYVAKRLEGCSHNEAIKWLENCVAVAGDDGLATQLDPAKWTEACELCGHAPKCKVRVDEPFAFLGRLYSKVSSVCEIVNSCQDPNRVFLKFTCCQARLVDVQERRMRLFQKACAVRTNDSESPFISLAANCIIKAAKREYNAEYEDVDIMLNYVINSGSYRNHYAEYMEWACKAAHPTADWDSWNEFFAGDRTFEEIENHPSFCLQIVHDMKGSSVYTRDEIGHEVKPDITKRGDAASVPDPTEGKYGKEEVDGAEYRKIYDKERATMTGMLSGKIAAASGGEPQASAVVESHKESGLKKAAPKKVVSLNLTAPEAKPSSAKPKGGKKKVSKWVATGDELSKPR